VWSAMVSNLKSRAGIHGGHNTPCLAGCGRAAVHLGSCWLLNGSQLPQDNPPFDGISPAIYHCSRCHSPQPRRIKHSSWLLVDSCTNS
jgi:hypothetical protein